MLVQSDRFGPLEIPGNKIITMEKPILGFEKLVRYCLIEQEEFLPFMWLQSLEDSFIAFIVVNPIIFFEDYRIRVHFKEVADLKVKSSDKVETYVIVNVPKNPVEMSVNLQGPILINTENNLAKQLVLVDSDYQIHHPLIEVTEETAKSKALDIDELVGV
ncbi:MAG: flagellar assembly protein FliW [candidate division Zixibacteria bacterium]|nr:flagellar assembly protein FliW [candidate division Zixibacteria bacterium]